MNKQSILFSICLLGLMLLPMPIFAQDPFDYDSTHVTHINAGGNNLLTGGGIYLIGSKDGTDNPISNYSSVGSNGNTMTNSGPPFKLTFWVKGQNTLGFKAEVGPVATSVNTLSMPFDFDKQDISKFAFSGTRYYLNGSSTSTSYSSGTYVGYNVIPQPYPIYRNGVLLGYTGVASTRQANTWGGVDGGVATVRVNILSSTHYRSMAFFNHFGTNNLEIQLGSFSSGEKATVEGEVIITPKQTSSLWTFQAETQLSHQIGYQEGDGWSVRVGDTPNRFMSYGPYTNAINGGRTASFKLLLDNVTADDNRILNLNVFDATTGRVLASRDLTRRQFTRALQYQNFDLNFTATAGNLLEFRTFWYGGSYVRQDNVVIR